MKKHINDFIKRGMLASVGGPLVYAIVLFILSKCGINEPLSVDSVILGIFSSSVLAFVSAGISVVYDIERLSLFLATLIHAVVIYLDYMFIYLLNGWSITISNLKSIMIFSIIFFAVHIVVWTLVYFSIRRSVTYMNQKIAR